MYSICRFRIDFAKSGVQSLVTICLGIFREFGTVSLIAAGFRKIDIPCHCLNVKTGSSAENRHLPPPLDISDVRLRFLGKSCDIKILRGFRHIDHIVGHTHHFLEGNFSGTDIHVSVYLHGIRRDDFPADFSRKFDRYFTFSGGGRTADHDQSVFIFCQNLYLLSFRSLRIFFSNYIFRIVLYDAFIAALDCANSASETKRSA